ETGAFAIMDRARAAGINFFDTAASYGGGSSESWIGSWRTERQAPILLSTKVFWSVAGDPADRGLSRDRILREIEGSLSRLRAERERRSEEHTSELQSLAYLVCRLLLEKKKKRER